MKNYIEHLNSLSAWDTALSIDAMIGKNELPDTFVHAFKPRVLFIAESQWEVVRILGSGGENQVSLIKNQATGEERVLKSGISVSGLGGSTIKQQRLMLQAGLPIVRMENAGPGHNFAERLNLFGSDVINTYLVTGDLAELPRVLELYKTILQMSSLHVQDLKPSNLGRRADGTWVISDWAFGLNWGDKLQRADLKSSIGADIGRGIIGAFRMIESSVSKPNKENLKQLVQIFHNATLLSEAQAAEVFAVIETPLDRSSQQH